MSGSDLLYEDRIPSASQHALFSWCSPMNRSAMQAREMTSSGVAPWSWGWPLMMSFHSFGTIATKQVVMVSLHANSVRALYWQIWSTQLDRSEDSMHLADRNCEPYTMAPHVS